MVNQLYVDLATEQGANAFLEQPTGPNGFNFFSADLRTANAIRKRERKKGKLNNTDREALRYIYEKMLHLAGHSDNETFCKRVPKSEFEAWLNHAVGIFRQITKDSKWINTGDLIQHDRVLLMTLVALFEHAPAVKLIFHEIQVLETISDMISALEHPPTATIARTVIGMVEFTFQTCRCLFEPIWKAEKTFKKLEATGILKQVIRCSPLVVTEASPIELLQELLACPAYVQKSFKEGTPCGDAVRAVLEGADWQHSRSTMAVIRPYMESLVQLSKGTVGVSMLDNLVHCIYCHKKGTKGDVKNCARCRQAVYCSRECQKADWKKHKKACIPHAQCKKVEKNILASQHMVNSFVYQRYVAIMLKMVEECDKAGGLHIDQMVAELDVGPDANGTIPLMKDPPEFHLVPVAKYLDGSRFHEPNSIFASKKDDQKYDERLVAMLQHQQSSRLSSELLCVVSHDGSYSFQRFDWADKGSQIPVFSPQALEGFRRVVRERDISLLWQIVTPEAERKVLLLSLELLGISDYEFKIDDDSDDDEKKE